MSQENWLKVYIDADVLFRAGTASHATTASTVLLRLSQYTMLEAITSEYAMQEAIRNVNAYYPEAVPNLLQLAARSLRIDSLPPPAVVSQVQTMAHTKDVPNLASAVASRAHILATFNLRDYFPQTGVIQVMTPGQLVSTSRTAIYQLAQVG